MLHNPHIGLWSTSCSWSKKYYKVERHLLFSFKLKRIFFFDKKVCDWQTCILPKNPSFKREKKLSMSLINLYSEEEEEEGEEEDLFVFNED